MYFAYQCVSLLLSVTAVQMRNAGPYSNSYFGRVRRKRPPLSSFHLIKERMEPCQERLQLQQQQWRAICCRRVPCHPFTLSDIPNQDKIFAYGSLKSESGLHRPSKWRHFIGQIKMLCLMNLLELQYSELYRENFLKWVLLFLLQTTSKQYDTTNKIIPMILLPTDEGEQTHNTLRIRY